MPRLSQPPTIVLRLGLMLGTIAGIVWVSSLSHGWAMPAQASGTVPVLCPRYLSTDLPKAIPDNQRSGITSTLVITNTGLTIQHLDVRIDSLVHAYDGDLRLTLISPTGQQISLIGDPGVLDYQGRDFYGTTLDDGFPTSILAGFAKFTGGFHPVQPLAVLKGHALNGTWRLRVADVAIGDVGTLQAWSLEICSLPAPVAAGGGALRRLAL